MNTVNSTTPSPDSFFLNAEKFRRSALGSTAGVLTDIYLEETNIAIWQRELSETLQESVRELLLAKPAFQTAMTVTPQSAFSGVGESLGNTSLLELNRNIAELVDMYCCLFDLKQVGLRLRALDHAMCPKFHVDKVPCRMITTFQGVATEWLPHQVVRRDKLGTGSAGKPDSQSGLYKFEEDIQSLNSGDVALLKGELWEGNENAGLVHRSPALTAGERRLVLTLDFSD